MLEWEYGRNLAVNDKENSFFLLHWNYQSEAALGNFIFLKLQSQTSMLEHCTGQVPTFLACRMLKSIRYTFV